MNCVVCGKEHNSPRRSTCGTVCWRKIKPKEYHKKLSVEAVERMKRNASRKYPCFTCLRFLGVKNSEIAKRHGINPRITSIATADLIPKPIAKAEKYKCGLCLRRVGLGACRVNKLLPVVSKCEWSAIFKRAGLQQLPMVDPIPYRYRISDLTYEEKELYRDSLELDAWFPDWDLDMMIREEATRSGLTYQGAAYRVSIHAERKKGSAAARDRHKRLSGCGIYKLTRAARAAVSRIKRFNSQVKCRKANQYLGCAIDHAAMHIEKQFKKGMTWANHGKVWHIDHIVPLASFNLSNDDHVLMCCHYTNLQPMWASDNIRKGDTVPTCQPQLALAY